MDDIRNATSGIRAEADQLREKAERQIWRHQHNRSWSKQEVVRQFDKLESALAELRTIIEPFRE